MITHTQTEPHFPERVVVLGANGFLGRTLISHLNAIGVETSGPSSRELDLSSPTAGRELAALLRPTDAVVMLAATKPGRQLDDRAFVANVSMAAALSGAIRERTCSHLIYLSSDAVYEFTPEPIRENSRISASHLYSLMHLARETMLAKIGEPPVAILRSTQVYGLGDSHAAYGPNRMIRSAVQEGQIILFGSGEETRDHIHVEDVVSVITEALLRRSKGLTNIASGHSVSFASLAELIVQACGTPVSIHSKPRQMPLLHRRFDIQMLQTAFPNRSATPLDIGIGLLLEQERRALIDVGQVRPLCK